MKYMLLMYWNQDDVPQTPQTPEAWSAARKPWDAFGQELEAAGVLLSNSGLAPVSNATTVRVREGKTLLTDGPFAETHEQLGGFYLLQCQDLDEAVRWAAKIPMAPYGSVEIRPTWSQK
jgi:hypothetical protein